jgi:hypothetical protein
MAIGEHIKGEIMLQNRKPESREGSVSFLYKGPFRN